VRFDDGFVVRAAYHFNVASVVRFEASIDQAHVHTKGIDAATTDHTGVSVSGNILGPWKTIWQLEYGYALRSDVKEVEGDQELLFIVLKLFDSWTGRRKDKTRGTTRQGSPSP
jgi:hypothetical protein